jgi:GNAT superfamily N-acetyltransferase
MLSIQPVTPAQIPTLLELIRELARFERLEHEVEATPESLQDSFFGPQPSAGALLASCDGEPAGYAIYFFTFSSFLGRRGLWLDDVYVRPSFRQQGIGGGLIEAVARIGVELRCGRFEWSALNWNKNALDFYRRLGARTLDDWVLLRTDATGMRRIAERPNPASSRRQGPNN